MTDPIERGLLHRAREGDADALAELCLAHLEAVYDFATWVTPDPAAAAEATRAAFAQAARRLPRLLPGVPFAPWLFGHALQAALALPAGAPPEPPSSAADPERLPSGAPLPPAEEVAVAASTVAALDPRSRAVLHLHLREGMQAPAVAIALRIREESAAILLSRVLPAAEQAIAGTLLTDPGRRCRRLTASIAARRAAGDATPAARLAAAHQRDCGVCTARRVRSLPPLVLYGALAAALPPPALTGQVLAAAQAAYRRPAPAPALVPGPPLPQPAAPRTKRAAILTQLAAASTAAAALLFTALILPGSPIAFDGPGDAPAAFIAVDESASPTHGPSRTAPPTPTRAAATASPSSTLTATPTLPAALSPTATGTATAPATPTPVPTATPTATAAPSATPTACPPLLDTNLPGRTLTMGSGRNDAVKLLNRGCGTLPFTTRIITGDEWLAISPLAGEITGPSNDIFISVAINDGALPEGPSTGIVQFDWSGGPLQVSISVSKVGSPPEIVAASGTCSDGIVFFATDVTDDVGVTSAVVTYSTPGGPSAQPMLRNLDSTHWETSFPFAPGATAFAIVIRDGAGQTASRSLDITPC